MQQLPKAVIFGCQGTALTNEERAFFERCQPLGFILFSRNCESAPQIRELISSLKECVKHKDVPILIDQEGGRVARLGPPSWNAYPAAALFGAIADEDLEFALQACEANAYILALELKSLGINVNCAPVLDLNTPGAHPVIGDRAFHESPETTAKLALAMVKGLYSAGITPVIKHIPGHGRARVDSHENLPRVTTSIADLQETDFASFRFFNQLSEEESLPLPWAMTAHICYDSIDNTWPATQSTTVINNIIRNNIRFKGLLVSDCLTMKALSGSFATRTELTLKAGCDVALHCSGNLDEMLEISGAAAAISPEGWSRFQSSIAPANEPSTPKKDFILIQERLLKYLNKSRLVS